MKTLAIAAVMLLAANAFASPPQAPKAWSEDEMKAYIRAEVKKQVSEALADARSVAPSEAVPKVVCENGTCRVQYSNGAQVRVGDPDPIIWQCNTGTCAGGCQSCPNGSCSNGECGMSGCGASASGGGGGCKGCSGGGRKFHLLGRRRK